MKRMIGSTILWLRSVFSPLGDLTLDLFNSFTAKVALMHPMKIVQSKLRRRLAKAASELGLHYFLFHLANTH